MVGGEAGTGADVAFGAVFVCATGRTATISESFGVGSMVIDEGGAG